MMDWKLLHKSESQLELDLMAKFLKENHGIETVLINKQVSGYNLGFWELLIHQDLLEEAKRLLQDTFNL